MKMHYTLFSNDISQTWIKEFTDTIFLSLYTKPFFFWEHLLAFYSTSSISASLRQKSQIQIRDKYKN